VLPEQPFPFALLDLHPLYRPALWKNWRTVAGAIGAWRQFDQIARKYQPALVLGTGGYASGLALAYAVRHSIPIVQQVADSHPGLTARWFARYTREAYVGYPEAVRFLHARAGAEMVDTGNPIEPPPEPRPDRVVGRRAWGFGSDIDSVLLVFGGSQGARALNAAVDGWIAAGIPPRLGVIWATGRASYDIHASRASATVVVRPYLSPISDAYAAADMALARAGAMTTAELCAWGIPMILVPLPTAAADHQTSNALALQAAGAAIHLPQSQLTAARVAEVVSMLAGDPSRRAALGAASRARGRPDAAQVIARRIARLVHMPTAG
jgi:UDP-N-acetylglucosamine--N-acetylmuramyl-(pentapeptide) pyrophosphoryl-undecaprenol N-acetylglucosamine transferase